jgi:hypothetical protein
VRNDQRRLIMGMIFIGIPLMFLLLPITQPYMVVCLGIAFHAVLWFLDCVGGAHIIPLPTPITWLIIGSGLGAALGYWTVAPSIGKRHMRRVAVLIPFIVLGGLTLVDLSYSLLNPPIVPPQTQNPSNQQINTFGRHNAEPAPTDPTLTPGNSTPAPITTASSTGGIPPATTP